MLRVCVCVCAPGPASLPGPPGPRGAGTGQWVGLILQLPQDRPHPGVACEEMGQEGTAGRPPLCEAAPRGPFLGPCTPPPASWGRSGDQSVGRTVGRGAERSVGTALEQHPGRNGSQPHLTRRETEAWRGRDRTSQDPVGGGVWATCPGRSPAGPAPRMPADEDRAAPAQHLHHPVPAVDHCHRAHLPRGDAGGAVWGGAWGGRGTLVPQPPQALGGGEAVLLGPPVLRTPSGWGQPRAPTSRLLGPELRGGGEAWAGAGLGPEP